MSAITDSTNRAIPEPIVPECSSHAQSDVHAGYVQPTEAMLVEWFRKAGLLDASERGATLLKRKEGQGAA